MPAKSIAPVEPLKKARCVGGKCKRNNIIASVRLFLMSVLRKSESVIDECSLFFLSEQIAFKR